MNPSFKYQLVLQFPLKNGDQKELDALLAVEENIESVSDSFEVDGNDFGSGEMNIFILTDDPEASLRTVRPKLKGIDGWAAAFRALDSETFTILWPPDKGAFEVK